MKQFILMLFALAGGMTLSGIVANIYRLVAKKPQGRLAACIHYAVMAVAGASVLLENSTRSFRRRDCSRFAYGFALALAAYWSFMIGLVLIETF